jgi:hypothetical protein
MSARVASTSAWASGLPRTIRASTSRTKRARNGSTRRSRSC